MNKRPGCRVDGLLVDVPVDVGYGGIHDGYHMRIPLHGGGAVCDASLHSGPTGDCSALRSPPTRFIAAAIPLHATQPIVGGVDSGVTVNISINISAAVEQSRVLPEKLVDLGGFEEGCERDSFGPLLLRGVSVGGVGGVGGGIGVDGCTG